MFVLVTTIASAVLYVVIFRLFYLFRRLPSWRPVFASLVVVLAIGLAAVVDVIVEDLAVR